MRQLTLDWLGYLANIPPNPTLGQQTLNTNLVWKITKHVLYIVDFIFYNKEKSDISL